VLSIYIFQFFNIVFIFAPRIVEPTVKIVFTMTQNPQDAPKKSRTSTFIMAIFAILLLGFIVFFDKIMAVYGSNVPDKLEDPYLCIPTGSTYEDVQGILKEKGFILDEKSFDIVADLMSYKTAQVRPGRFKIKGGWGNRDLVKHLRGGEQSPVKISLNYERMSENVAAKAARYIEADSTAIAQLLQDSNYLDQYGYTPQTVMSVFIPNTYEFFWNTSPQQFLERMMEEHKKFWSKNDRLSKAESLNMSPKEVYTLASIVEKETLANSEKLRIAGVYLNRLTSEETGRRLQADPTVVFATRDFDTRRVTQKHLKFDSPYNTYLYAGLPPGPISMANMSSIDAVLNAEKHNYVFFCAKPDNSGLHTFAETYKQHLVNVAKYHQLLNAKGVK
jgi:UPF0755 protein